MGSICEVVTSVYLQYEELSIVSQMSSSCELLQNPSAVQYVVSLHSIPLLKAAAHKSENKLG